MLIVTLSESVLIRLCSITCYEIIPCPKVMKMVSQMSFSNSVSLPFTFNSSIYLELTFVCNVRQGFHFFFSHVNT